MSGMVFWTSSPPEGCTWKRQASATGRAEIGSADHFLVEWPCSDLSLQWVSVRLFFMQAVRAVSRSSRSSVSTSTGRFTVLTVDPGMIQWTHTTEALVEFSQERNPITPLKSIKRGPVPDSVNLFLALMLSTLENRSVRCPS